MYIFLNLVKFILEFLKKKKRRSKQQYYKSDQVFEACSRYNFSTLAHFSWYQFVLILDSQPRTTCDPPPVSDLSLSAAYCLHNTVIHIVVWYFYCAIDVYFFYCCFCVSCETRRFLFLIRSVFLIWLFMHHPTATPLPSPCGGSFCFDCNLQAFQFKILSLFWGMKMVTQCTVLSIFKLSAMLAVKSINRMTAKEM